MGNQWNWAYNPYKWSSIITLLKAGSGARPCTPRSWRVSNALETHLKSKVDSEDFDP